jgi:hypothetical protein
MRSNGAAHGRAECFIAVADSGDSIALRFEPIGQCQNEALSIINEKQIRDWSGGPRSRGLVRLPMAKGLS